MSCEAAVHVPAPTALPCSSPGRKWREGTPWLVDHVCLERPGGYRSPAWERQGGASQFDDSNLHFEHASFLCCGNKIPYLLFKKGSVFFSSVLRGRGWKGFRLFPSRLQGRELQCHRASSWESRGEGSALESDVSRSFSRVEGEPLEKSLCAVGVSAAAC